ncbi:MAG: adenosylmethionine--8-amino-7-oxononanoate transaminase [Rudaea sp.]
MTATPLPLAPQHEDPAAEGDRWRERDLAVLWHPCTQMHDHTAVDGPRLPLTPIARGEGVWLVDHAGRRYLDAISSWWTNLFGHANARIGAAIKDQVDRLEQVIFAGFSHEPAIRLAEELLRVAPRGLARVFYADNGSSAIEVALKMSFHFWTNQGGRNQSGRTHSASNARRPRKTRFVALSGGYHGETLGALSVTDVPLYRATYAPLLGSPIFVASPDCHERAEGDDWRTHSLRLLAEMRATLARHADEVCAVIVEPLVQCAGGMRMYHPAYLAGLRALCDEFDVHLIADEIAVGFGRTGTLFACEQAQITPDFLCLSKGLTGGFLPLSAVLTRQSIYDAFYAEYSSGKAFLHSHSYTGNPLACRAALETLAIFRDEPVLERNRVLAAHLAARLAPLAAHPNVSEVRQTGMIAAVELVQTRQPRTPFAAAERRGIRVYLHALAHGVLLRPLGDVIYFMPPYVITLEEIDCMVDAAVAAIEHAVA